MGDETEADVEVRMSVKVEAAVRNSLQALRQRRELAEGRPVRLGEIVADLVRAAERGASLRG